MKTFKEFLAEKKYKKLPWKGNPDIGWWADKPILTLYHGTHIRNVPLMEKSGINKPDPSTGMISMALEPNTAFGYAAMSGAGGEADFRKAGSKPKNTHPSERAVLVAEIPQEWVQKNIDQNLSGNIGNAKKHLQNKEEYDKWPSIDAQYYQLSELRFKKPIPNKFIVGYMQK